MRLFLLMDDMKPSPVDVPHRQRRKAGRERGAAIALTMHVGDAGPGPGCVPKGFRIARTGKEARRGWERAGRRRTGVAFLNFGGADEVAHVETSD